MNETKKTATTKQTVMSTSPSLFTTDDVRSVVATVTAHHRQKISQHLRLETHDLSQKTLFIFFRILPNKASPMGPDLWDTFI